MDDDAMKKKLFQLYPGLASKDELHQQQVLDATLKQFNSKLCVRIKRFKMPLKRCKIPLKRCDAPLKRSFEHTKAIQATQPKRKKRTCPLFFPEEGEAQNVVINEKRSHKKKTGKKEKSNRLRTSPRQNTFIQYAEQLNNTGDINFQQSKSRANSPDTTTTEVKTKKTDGRRFNQPKSHIKAASSQKTQKTVENTLTPSNVRVSSADTTSKQEIPETGSRDFQLAKSPVNSNVAAPSGLPSRKRVRKSRAKSAGTASVQKTRTINDCNDLENAHQFTCVAHKNDKLVFTIDVHPCQLIAQENIPYKIDLARIIQYLNVLEQTNTNAELSNDDENLFSNMMSHVLEESNDGQANEHGNDDTNVTESLNVGEQYDNDGVAMAQDNYRQLHPKTALADFFETFDCSEAAELPSGVECTTYLLEENSAINDDCEPFNDIVNYIENPGDTANQEFTSALDDFLDMSNIINGPSNICPESNAALAGTAIVSDEMETVILPSMPLITTPPHSTQSSTPPLASLLPQRDTLEAADANMGADIENQTEITSLQQSLSSSNDNVPIAMEADEQNHKNKNASNIADAIDLSVLEISLNFEDVNLMAAIDEIDEIDDDIISLLASPLSFHDLGFTENGAEERDEIRNESDSFKMVQSLDTATNALSTDRHFNDDWFQMASFFGATCPRSFIGDCSKKNCPNAHNFHDARILERALLNFSDQQLNNLYTFMKSYGKLFKLYFRIFCNVFAARKNRRKLQNMIQDYYLFEECFSDCRSNEFTNTLFECLLKTGMSKIEACKQIIKHLPTTITETIHGIVDIIFRTNWTAFIPEIKHFMTIENYVFKTSVLDKMTEVILQTGDPTLGSMFMDCLLKNRVKDLQNGYTENIASLLAKMSAD